jgi:SAM-dependent methyltransferase
MLGPMSAEVFDDLTDVYEATIDWPKRLGNEQGLFRWLFDRVHAKRILDVACGTGRHAAMFHSWGLEVEAADISPNMIRRCGETHGEPPGLRWIARPFDQPAEQPGSFDVAMCIGNSLALAPDERTLAAAIGHMLAAVRPGGAVITHVPNLFALPDAQPVWQKCVRALLPRGDCLIIKGIHRCGDRGFVNLLVTRLDAPSQPALRTECVPFMGLQSDELEQLARQSGAAGVEFVGDYRRQQFDPAKSPDLIMICIK